MATYDASLFPVTTSPSRASAFATLIASSGGWFYPGTIIADTSGLVAKLRIWGTAASFHHSNFGTGASYKVKVDGTFVNGGSPFTGTGAETTVTWFTGLTEAWHDVEIWDFVGNNPGVNGYTYWDGSHADIVAIQGVTGGSEVGLRVTYTTLPSGYSIPLSYATGWGQARTWSELAAFFGSNALVAGPGNGTYTNTLYLRGRSDADMTIRYKSSDSTPDLIVAHSQARTPTSDDPAPFSFVQDSRTRTGDSYGLLTATIPQGSTFYTLLFGFQSASVFIFSDALPPNVAVPSTLDDFSFCGNGDSIESAGFADSGHGVVGSYALSPAGYFGLLTDSQPSLSLAIPGSKLCAYSVDGPASSGTALCSPQRIAAAIAASWRNMCVSIGINDITFVVAGTPSWNPATNWTADRATTAGTWADDAIFTYKAILDAHPTRNIFVCTQNQGVNSATMIAMRDAIESRISAAFALGYNIFAVRAFDWGSGAYPVYLADGTHPTAENVGMGNRARHWLVAMQAVITPTTVSSVTITEGASLTMLPESTTTLHADVAGTGTLLPAVFTTQSGSHTVNGNTGVVTSPGAGLVDKVSVIRASSPQDPTKYDEITITTRAFSSATGGSRRRPTRGRG